MQRPTLGLLILATLLAATSAFDERLSAVQPAFAQDDDGGDNDGDGDDGDDGGTDLSSGGDGDGAPPTRRNRQPRRQPATTPAPPVQNLPQRAGNEVIALGLTPAELAEAVAQGFAVVEERSVAILGLQGARLRVPDGQNLDTARAALALIAPASLADFNHYYRAEQDNCAGPHCAARAQIAWPRSAPGPVCRPGVPAPGPGSAASATAATASRAVEPAAAIGMIDTGINADHEAFAAADIQVIRLAPAEFAPSGAQHGTAVASILVGSDSSRTPGLVPAARLVAVDVFHRDGGDERSDAFSLIAGLDLLAQRGVGVVNLSLAGPPNEPVRQMIAALRAQGIVVISAAGNGGPKAEPAFPAAYEGVIAVTAVDARGGVYRRAAQGPHIDIAAPGVDVWAAASVKGARPKTGTSFAVPFVTAAAHLLRAGGVPAAEIEVRLAASATDLGEAGRDSVFGHGLLSLEGLCVPPRD